MPRQKSTPRRSAATKRRQKRASHKSSRKAFCYDSTTDENSSDGEPQPRPVSTHNKTPTRQTASEIEARKENVPETSGPKVAISDSPIELFRVSSVLPSPQQTPPRCFRVGQNCSPSPRSLATSTPKPAGPAEPPEIPCDISFSEQSTDNEQIAGDVSSIIDSLSSSISSPVRSPYRKEQGGLLANTQPSDILKEVTAYVEVRSGTEDISMGLVALLQKLGATVLKRMGRSATHVVFRHGRVSTRKKALEWNIPMVSPLWVENCRLHNRKVSEVAFLAKVPSAYDCPILSKKIRKPKSWRTAKPLLPAAATPNKSPTLQKPSTGHQSAKVAPSKASVPAEPTPELPPSPIGSHGLATAVDGGVHKPSSPRTPQHRRSLRTELLKLNAETFKKRKAECNAIAEHSVEDVGKNNAAEEVEKQPRRRHRQLFSQDEAAKSFIIAQTPPVSNRVAPFLEEEDEELVPLSKRLQAEMAARDEEAKQDSVDDSLLYYIRRYRIANAPVDAEESNAEESLKTSATSHYNQKRKREKIKSSKAKSQKKGKRSTSENVPAVETADGNKTDTERRSSLDDFKPNVPSRKKPKSLSWLESSLEDGTSLENNAASVVLTSVKPSEEETILGIVKGLGRFKVEERVSARTTHLVCGDRKRTLNLLFALAQGCWVLSPKWVYASLEAGEWVGEEEYELSDYFPAVKMSRIEKQTSDCGDLFGNVGLIYVSQSSIPPCDQLRLLVERAGGKVAQSYLRCDVAVGPVPQGKRLESVMHVSEKWILDSISEHKTLPLEDYST